MDQKGNGRAEEQDEKAKIHKNNRKTEILGCVQDGTSKKDNENETNMIELKRNFKGKYDNTICPACEKEEETTEHVIRCKEYQRLTQHTLVEGEEDEFNLPDKIDNVAWLIKAGEGLEKIEETRKWLLGIKN